MEDKGIVVVDFSGTLVKKSLAERANRMRYEALGLELPSEEEQRRQHGTKQHYDPLRERISEIFGITDNMTIYQVQNNGTNIALSGRQYQTVIMTDMHRDNVFKIARKDGQNVFFDGMQEALAKIRGRGYKLAIVSGTRTDIIAGVLAITGFEVKFDYLYGQDAILSRDDSGVLMEKLARHGTIAYVIGDKLSDIEYAPSHRAKSIWVKWGHPNGGEEQFADYCIERPEELEKIIQ